MMNPHRSVRLVARLSGTGGPGSASVPDLARLRPLGTLRDGPLYRQCPLYGSQRGSHQDGAELFSRSAPDRLHHGSLGDRRGCWLVDPAAANGSRHLPGPLVRGHVSGEHQRGPEASSPAWQVGNPPLAAPPDASTLHRSGFVDRPGITEVVNDATPSKNAGATSSSWHPGYHDLPGGARAYRGVQKL